MYGTPAYVRSACEETKPLHPTRDRAQSAVTTPSNPLSVRSHPQMATDGLDRACCRARNRGWSSPSGLLCTFPIAARSDLWTDDARRWGAVRFTRDTPPQLLRLRDSFLIVKIFSPLGFSPDFARFSATPRVALATHELPTAWTQVSHILSPGRPRRAQHPVVVRATSPPDLVPLHRRHLNVVSIATDGCIGAALH